MNGTEAVAEIEKQSPDLLFLDVQMPEMDGFEVLQNISAERLPVVIFTTAFDMHAVRAFDVHALDYLLKPFKPARFKKALQRAREQIANKQAGSVAHGLLEMLSERKAFVQQARIAVKTDQKVLFIAVNDIDSIESAGNYVVIYAGKEEHILRDTLTNSETRLPAKKFLRISRAAIVNLDQVKELQPMFRGESVVVLKNGRAVPTTRSFREIQEKLEFR